jgi:GxxExxY protein
MPIRCQLDVRPLTADEFQELDYRVMGHAFASQNELGRLCEEEAYQRDLKTRLMEDGFRSVHIEVPVSVSYRDFTKVYSLDLVADDAVYELKTAAALSGEHQSQLLNYLFLLGIPRGKLINFRPPKVQGRIHATSLTAEHRYRVRVDTSRWQELSEACGEVCQVMQHLLVDWGAFLALELYQQALTHFCGGEEHVIQRLPLNRDGIRLGTQRFHIHSPDTAFRVTAVTEELNAMEAHLRRLLALTGLRALQWINLDHHTIQFVTITQ